jgi:hypothetical protein
VAVTRTEEMREGEESVNNETTKMFRLCLNNFIESIEVFEMA